MQLVEGILHSVTALIPAHAQNFTKDVLQKPVFPQNITFYLLNLFLLCLKKTLKCFYTSWLPLLSVLQFRDYIWGSLCGSQFVNFQINRKSFQEYEISNANILSYHDLSANFPSDRIILMLINFSLKTEGGKTFCCAVVSTVAS